MPAPGAHFGKRQKETTVSDGGRGSVHKSRMRTGRGKRGNLLTRATNREGSRTVGYTTYNYIHIYIFIYIINYIPSREYTHTYTHTHTHANCLYTGGDDVRGAQTRVPWHRPKASEVEPGPNSRCSVSLCGVGTSAARSRAKCMPYELVGSSCLLLLSLFVWCFDWLKYRRHHVPIFRKQKSYAEVPNTAYWTEYTQPSSKICGQLIT